MLCEGVWTQNGEEEEDVVFVMACSQRATRDLEAMEARCVALQAPSVS